MERYFKDHTTLLQLTAVGSAVANVPEHNKGLKLVNLPLHKQQNTATWLFKDYITLQNTVM